MRSPGRDYEGLYSAIQGCGQYFHALESTWFVKSDLSANQIYECLKGYIDSNDHIVISKIESLDMQGWMLRIFWEWINDDTKPSVK